MKTQIDRNLRAALDTLPVPWRLEERSKHVLVIAGNRRVLTLSRTRQRGSGRELANDIACVRRAAREMRA